MTQPKEENICYSCSRIKEAHGLDYESTCIDCRARELKRENNEQQECVCGEINARNCPVHQSFESEWEQKLIEASHEHDNLLFRQEPYGECTHSRSFRCGAEYTEANLHLHPKVRRLLNYNIQHDLLCGIVGGYGYCTCGLDQLLKEFKPEGEKDD